METGACLFQFLNPIPTRQEQCSPWHIIKGVFWIKFFMEPQGYSQTAVPSRCSQNASFRLNKELAIFYRGCQKICSTCQTCAEAKSLFHKQIRNTLTKATQSIERTSIDFKVPFPLCVINKYIFTGSSVIVIIVGNGHGEQSSNPARSCS